MASTNVKFSWQSVAFVLVLLTSLSLQGCSINDSPWQKPPAPLEKVDCDTAVKFICIAMNSAKVVAKEDKDKELDPVRANLCPDREADEDTAKKKTDKLEATCRDSCGEFEGAKDEKSVEKLIHCLEEAYQLPHAEGHEDEQQKKSQSTDSTSSNPEDTAKATIEELTGIEQDEQTTSTDQPEVQESGAKSVADPDATAAIVSADPDATAGSDATGADATANKGGTQETESALQSNSTHVARQATQSILQLLKQDRMRKSACTARKLRASGGGMSRQYF